MIRKSLKTDALKVAKLRLADMETRVEAFCRSIESSTQQPVITAPPKMGFPELEPARAAIGTLLLCGFRPSEI